MATHALASIMVALLVLSTTSRAASADFEHLQAQLRQRPERGYALDRYIAAALQEQPLKTFIADLTARAAAAQATPDDSRLLAIVLTRTGQTTAAVAALRAAVQRYPSSLPITAALASAYFDEGLNAQGLRTKTHGI